MLPFVSFSEGLIVDNFHIRSRIQESARIVIITVVVVVDEEVGV